MAVHWPARLTPSDCACSGCAPAGLSDRAGISVSTLFRLKTGQRRPTLEQPLPLTKVYGVTLDELLDAPPTGDPRITLRSVAGGDGSTILSLARRSGGSQADKFILPRGVDRQLPDLRSHEGHGWFCVPNGTRRLVVGE